LLSATGTTTSSYTFTGRESDSLGIDYYRARYYNPTTGRFLSEDPLGFLGGINKYVYAKNNPMSFRDLLGFCAGGSNPISGALSAFTVAAAAVVPTLSGQALTDYMALETSEIAVIGKLANLGTYMSEGFNVFSTPYFLVEDNLAWVASVIEQEMPVIIASDLTEANLLGSGGIALEDFSMFAEELSMFLEAGYDFALLMEADEVLLVLMLL